MQTAQLFEHLKVLHISGAHLNDVHILEQKQLRKIHDLGDDGQSGLFLRFEQKLDAFAPQTLKRVGRGAGLKGAAPQEGCARLFHIRRHRTKLFTAFHRAGTGDHTEVPAAYFGIAHGNDRIIGMEFSVGVFVRLLDPFYGLHHLQRVQRVDIHRGGVAHQTQNGGMGAAALVDVQPHTAQTFHQFFYLQFTCILFEYNDHNKRSLLIAMKKTLRAVPAGS